MNRKSIKQSLLLVAASLSAQLTQAQSCPTGTQSFAVSADGMTLYELSSTFAGTVSDATLAGTFAVAMGADGKVYYAPYSTADAVKQIYQYDPSTDLSSILAGKTLPSLGAGNYYISGGSDTAGYLYFTGNKGQAAYKIHPTNPGAATALWTSGAAILADPERPHDLAFTTNAKDVVVQADGSLLFIEYAAHHIWLVDPATLQSTYRGKVSGLGTGSVSDVFYRDGNLYVSTSANGIYQINTTTLAATAVTGSMSAVADVATAPCEAGTLPALLPPATCDSASSYTVSNIGTTGYINRVNSSTFVTEQSYALPFNTNSVAWGSNGYVYSVARTAPVPVGGLQIYGLNPVTGAVFNTGWTLPALPLGSEHPASESFRFYISGASDTSGNIYFSSNNGYFLGMVNTTTGTVTELWNRTSATPLTTSGAPVGVTFHQDYKDLTIDANGDYYFVDDLDHHVWQVIKGTTTAIYRGTITGDIGTNAISDIIFNEDKVYITASAIGSGVYEIDPSTYVSTLVTGAGTFAYSDAASVPCAALPLELRISGKIHNDGNGYTDTTVSTNGDNALNPIVGSNLDGAALYVTLVNSSNVAIATVPVSDSGTYVFNNVPAGTYSLVLSTIATGTTDPNSPLPAGWYYTGEQQGTTPGGADATPNGVLTGITVGGTNDEKNANFGINKGPISEDVIATIPQPAPNDAIPLNGLAGNPPLMNGEDNEDGGYLGSAGNAQGVVITSLPTNGQLWYDGVMVTDTDITNGTLFEDPSLFSVVFTGTGYTSTSFEYAYVDAAGFASIEPAVYELNWSTPLPVKFISFDVSKNGQTALLDWATASEQNNKGFEIERSADGKSWAKIGFTASIAVNGNSNAKLEYNFTDNTPMNGQNFYRLKQVDFDGKFEYSTVRQLLFDDVQTISLYPNPVKDVLYIDGLKGGELIKICDVSGKVIQQFTGTATTVVVNMQQATKGVYFINIVDATGGTKSKKVIKF